MGGVLDSVGVVNDDIPLFGQPGSFPIIGHIQIIQVRAVSLPGPSQITGILFPAVAHDSGFINIAVRMLDAEFTDNKGQVLVQYLIYIALHHICVPGCVLVHMDREHGVFQRIGIEYFGSMGGNGIRKLSVPCSVYHNRILDSGISQLRDRGLIAVGPSCRIPFPIPFVGYVEDDGFFLTDQGTFHFDPVIGDVVQHRRTVRACSVMHLKNSD
ncbi:hypothetical protein D3C75_660260 [compost metagenome]